MSGEHFFDEQLEQSRIKTAIVSKYFWSWANVILPTVKKRDGILAYIDLFAGPGRYEDGTKSTPLLILEQAIADSEMRKRLVTLFNDRDTNNVQALQKAIETLPGIETLKFKPKVQNNEVGSEIVGMFSRMKMIPTFFFVDPWGYKGLSLQLINSVVRNWGSDCIFFFNYNRINMGLGNPIVKEHMDALFGVDRANTLRSRLSSLLPDERELTIVEELAQALKDMGGNFVLPFRFKAVLGSRTSHHLIFVSKHIRGYDIMKGIMASQSSSSEEGVSSFEYNPATERQQMLFGLRPRPLQALKEELLTRYSGQQLIMGQIYNDHNVGTPFISANYKEALRQLEAEGRIITNPPASKRPKARGKTEVTFGDKVEVTFP